MSVVVVLTTIPAEKAKAFARALVEARVAACVNIVPKVQSIYGYEGEIHDEEEALLIIKTSDNRGAELRAKISAEHPYDVPEIVSFDSDAVSDSYALFVEGWVGS